MAEIKAMKTIIKCLIHDANYVGTQDHLSKWIDCNFTHLLGVNCPRVCEYTDCKVGIPKSDIERAFINNKRYCKQHRLIVLKKELEKELEERN